MADPSTREIIRGHYDAWTSRDLDRARGYLADDLDFQGSLRRHNRADEFIPALDQFLQIYDCVTGPASTIRTAEAFTVRAGKIREIRLVFDPTELIKLGRQPQ
jgi:hypothetical protein